MSERADLTTAFDLLESVSDGLWHSIQGVDDSDPSNWHRISRAKHALAILSRAMGYVHHWREMGRADCEAAARVNHWAREHHS